MNDDKDFKKEVKKAVDDGCIKISDICEVKIINKINEDNIQAIIFWLRHHKKEYRVKDFIINNKIGNEKI